MMMQLQERRKAMGSRQVELPNYTSAGILAYDIGQAYYRTDITGGHDAAKYIESALTDSPSCTLRYSL